MKLYWAITCQLSLILLFAGNLAKAETIKPNKYFVEFTNKPLHSFDPYTYFDINSMASGDSVGFAIITTNSQAIYTTLKAGGVVSSNYASINSIDSNGVLIGAFSIENTTYGIKFN